MPVIENDFTYTFIQDVLPKRVDVYIDSSFGNAQEYSQSRYGVPYGTGWVMTVGQRKDAIGYGVSLAWNTPCNYDSMLGEIRGILGFLDHLYEARSNLLNEQTTYRIFCDNLSIKNFFNSNFIDEKESKKMHQRLGVDYEKMLFYITHMKLEFLWVKGHAANIFNNAADIIARRCYRDAVKDKDYMGEIRRTHVHMELKNQGIRVAANENIRKSTVKTIKDTTDVLTVSDKKVTRENLTDVGIAFHQQLTNRSHYTVLSGVSSVRNVVNIQSIRFALETYLGNLHESPKALIVKTDMSDKIVDLINHCLKNTNSKAIKNSHPLIQSEMLEIQKLKGEIAMKFIYEQTSITNALRGILNVAVDTKHHEPFSLTHF